MARRSGGNLSIWNIDQHSWNPHIAHNGYDILRQGPLGVCSWNRIWTQNSPLIRGAIIGAVVSLLIAIPSGITGGALLMVEGVVYGIITDIVATKFSPDLNRVSID